MPSGPVRVRPGDLCLEGHQDSRHARCLPLRIPFSERPVIWKAYNSLLFSGWHRPGKVTVQKDGILPQMLWKSEGLGLPSGERCWAGVRSQASLPVSPLCSQAVSYTTHLTAVQQCVHRSFLPWAFSSSASCRIPDTPLHESSGQLLLSVPIHNPTGLGTH